MPPSPSTSRLPQDLPARVAAGLAKIALVYRHEAWRASGERGLTPTQSQILATIAGATRPIGIKSIAEALAITMGTVSAAVSTLVEKGLVRKERSASDARAIVLELTPEGERRADAAAAWPDTVLDAAAALPDRDQAGLIRGLVGLIRALQDRGSVPTSRMCVNCRFFRPNVYPGQQRAHHCMYIDEPIGDADLRVECQEMEPAPDDLRPRLWQVFLEGRPFDDSEGERLTPGATPPA